MATVVTHRMVSTSVIAPSILVPMMSIDVIGFRWKHTTRTVMTNFVAADPTTHRSADMESG
jgi:hypothetical protein